MSISEKPKAVKNKTEQNKTEYDLEKQTAKTSALLSGNVNKYGYLTDKDVLPRNYLLEKGGTLKRFEYFPLGKKLKAQTDIVKKHYKK